MLLTDASLQQGAANIIIVINDKIDNSINNTSTDSNSDNDNNNNNNSNNGQP